MIPSDFLRDTGLAVVPWAVIAAREARAWLVGWHGERGVLRARPVPAEDAARARLLDDVAWLQAFLARLARQGFPAPRPLPAFAGQSWAVAHGQLWELVSYLPGRAVGWDGIGDLPALDGMLITHAHHDHSDLRAFVGYR
jgi:Ser/Thr protein kinase RdoA (MazF antagonist)